MSANKFSSRDISLPGRYASSLFESIHAAERPFVYVVFKSLCEAILSSLDVMKHLNVAGMSKDESEKFWQHCLQEYKVPEIFIHFLCLIQQVKRLKLIHQIFKIFEELYNQDLGITSACLISAAPLSSTDQKHMTTELSKRLGKQLDLTFESNAQLVDGFCLKTPSFMIDVSVANQIERLEKILRGW
jgi:F-type H+-transporting ATPase subunit delta